MTAPSRPGGAEQAAGRRSAIHRVVRASLDQPLLAVTAALAVGAVGVWSFSRLPVDAYPDLSPPQVELISQWPGHAAEEVERLITVPVETEMNGLPRLDVARSISLYGLSAVRLRFLAGPAPHLARERGCPRLRYAQGPA